jgi:hypothetical protein
MYNIKSMVKKKGKTKLGKKKQLWIIIINLTTSLKNISKLAI